MLQFVYGVTVKNRCNMKPMWRKWGPLWFILIASFGSMADITRQIMLDSRSAALVSAEGDAAAFNFDQCTYTATASALTASVSASCSRDPVVITQISALGDEGNKWLSSSLCVNACSLFAWAGVVLTVMGFVWLSEVLTWIRGKRAELSGGLGQVLLSSENYAAGECKECRAV